MFQPLQGRSKISVCTKNLYLLKLISIASALDESIFAVGSDHGFDVFRLTSSQTSCRAISKILEVEGINLENMKIALFYKIL